MLAVVKIKYWEFPIFQAEPEGFEHIRVTITEPSNKVKVEATIPIDEAHKFGDFLVDLCKSLESASDKR